jgi:hypothetical protein
MPTRDRDYQLMMTALADLTRRRDHELDRAEQAYQDSTARAAGELGRTEGDAATADRWAGAAAGQVLDVDREAARLWERLRHARGMRALGEMPEPVPVEAVPRIALQRRPSDSPATGRESARALLARAEMRIEDTVRPAGRRPLPRWMLPLLPFLGALTAGASGLIAAGLVTIGEAGVPAGAAIAGLGWFCFLAAPSAGIPVAVLLAHHHQRTLPLFAIGLVLLGGMLTATPLSLSFAASH